MKRFFLYIFISSIFILIQACSKEDSPSPEGSNNSIKIEGLNSNQDIFVNEKYVISSETTEGITKVEYFLNGALIGSSIAAPFVFEWGPKDLPSKEYTITAVGITSDKKEVRHEVKLNLKLRLGDIYQGGRIFFIKPDGKTGLIAAITDLKVGSKEVFRWGQPGVLLGVTMDNGMENTKLLVENIPTNDVSDTYMGYYFKGGLNLNGFRDWYIPSIRESELLVEHKEFVSNYPTSSNEARYWTSSEINDMIGYPINWIATMGTSTNKSSFMFKVRPVRQF